MRVHHNETLHRLTENLLQLHCWEFLRRNKVSDDIARPHARQLVAVADQDQTAADGQRAQNAFKHIRVHHGKLIDDHCVTLQRIALVSLEHRVIVVVPVHL